MKRFGEYRARGLWKGDIRPEQQQDLSAMSMGECLSSGLIKSKPGVSTHFHQGPHQPHGFLQRAECNLGLYTCNYSLTVKRELSTAAR